MLLASEHRLDALCFTFCDQAHTPVPRTQYRAADSLSPGVARTSFSLPSHLFDRLHRILNRIVKALLHSLLLDTMGVETLNDILILL